MDLLYYVYIDTSIQNIGSIPNTDTTVQCVALIINDYNNCKAVIVLLCIAQGKLLYHMTNIITCYKSHFSKL